MTNGIKRSHTRALKQCLHCTTNFSVANYRKDSALYCGRKCLALAARIEVTTKCDVCESFFTHIASRANKAKYCSRKCYYKSLVNKGTKEYVCAHCDKTFLDAPSHKRKYCSKACVNKAKLSEWKPSYITARKNMIKRNMLVKCERCDFDRAPAILGVHHKDRDRKNNDISNLEVLCPNCHSEEHSKHICHGFSG